VVLQVGAASALLPAGVLGGFDASFLEEPVMLLAFVLLGRALEARAKVRQGRSAFKEKLKDLKPTIEELN